MRKIDKRTSLKPIDIYIKEVYALAKTKKIPLLPKIRIKALTKKKTKKVQK